MSTSDARSAMPLLDDPRALVDERVDEAVHDLVVGDPARRDAELGAVLRDHLLDELARDRVALARDVVVPARAGLLAEAAHFAQQVGGLAVAQVGLLDVAALADAPISGITALWFKSPYKCCKFPFARLLLCIVLQSIA